MFHCWYRIFSIFFLIEFLIQGIVALFVLLWLQWNIIDFNFVLGYFCAQRRGEAPVGMIVQRVVQQSMLWAKTGRSPSRITAQGNTLGNSEPSNLRSERAIGMILRCVLATSFCSFRAPNSNTNPTQGDTLGNSGLSNLRSERAIGMILRCVLATSFCSFRAQNSNKIPPRVIPWAIILLGLRPAVAVGSSLYTLSFRPMIPINLSSTLAPFPCHCLYWLRSIASFCPIIIKMHRHQ